MLAPANAGEAFDPVAQSNEMARKIASDWAAKLMEGLARSMDLNAG